METESVDTILIIDDNENEVILTRRVLSRIVPGIRTEAAHSGEAGLAFLRSAEALPSLVLLDLKMPGMGGINTLGQIRADGRLRSIPVIVVTNSSLESDRRESLEGGADAFLHKSFDLDLFAEDIRVALERWLGKEHCF